MKPEFCAVSAEVEDKDLARREDATLKRLLATPPQPKPKKDAGASPKKRGRPAKGRENDKC
jgi:hypothetical protein